MQSTNKPSSVFFDTIHYTILTSMDSSPHAIRNTRKTRKTQNTCTENTENYGKPIIPVRKTRKNLRTLVFSIDSVLSGLSRFSVVFSIVFRGFRSWVGVLSKAKVCRYIGWDFDDSRVGFWCFFSQVQVRTYTLPQKKRNFNFQIFHDDPGPGSETPGHVHQGIWLKVHWPTLLPKRKATSEKLRFFWGRV